MEAAAIGQAVGAFVQPAGQATHGIYTSLKQVYYDVKNMDRNFGKLEDKIKDMRALERDVKSIIEIKVLMEKTDVCTTWLCEMSRINKDFDNLERRYNIAKTKKTWRHWSSKGKLSKDMISKKDVVVELMNRIDLQNVVRDKRPAKVVHKHGKKIYDVPSQNENVVTLQRHLQDNSIRTIGVWGAPGIGKTTILKLLHDEIGKTNTFDIVIWVTVSKNGSTAKVVEAIAKRLKLEVEDININNQDQVLDMIYATLKGRKYLLLLDDVFPENILDDLGIHDTRDDDHGKVVVASRGNPSGMGVDEEVNVKRLSKPDAWNMFKEIVGDVVERPGITPIARKVLHECGQLPQIINAVGKTLKHVDKEAIWRTKLNELQRPSGSILQDMEEAFIAFKLACHALDDNENESTVNVKDCLLYGALFPEEHDIYQDFLIECWKAEHLIHISSLVEARYKGHTILDKLINASLLERGKSIEHVKMSMLFKNMALRYIELNNADLLKSGKEITARVSLMCTQSPTLSDMPKCSTISTLLLRRNEVMTTIPNFFFTSMCLLRVLDLYKTKIDSLPSSISNLKELRSLYLNYCTRIVELPEEIEELTLLEVLDIRGTGIHTLPSIIKKLVNLACLRVSFAKDTDAQQGIMISPSIIGNLSKLEELTIDVDTNEKRWGMVVNYIAKEVASLKTLSTLNFYFPDIKCFEEFKRDMEWENSNRSIENLESFRLLVGTDGATHHENNIHISKPFNERYLRYSGDEKFTNVMLEVLERVITFELIGHCIQSLSDFGMDRFNGLQICIIKDCEKMESIVDASTTNCVTVPFLEHLHVIKLPKLVHILKELPQSGSFAKLTTLQLCGCPMMKIILPEGVTKHLAKLQVLRVDDCSQVQHIIETDDTSVGLPELKILELMKLPQLVRIYPSDSLSWPTLEKVEITSCDLLKNLPFSKEKASKLRRIECHKVWWTKLDWASLTVKDSLESMCSFI